MAKVFIDTNIFVYTFDGAYPAKQKQAIELLRNLCSQDSGAAVSTQVLQEFYNVLTRKLSVPVPVAKHEMLLLTRYELVILNPPLLADAADLHATASLSFWDALLVAAARFADCDELWTEDLQDGRYFGKLRIVNPFNSFASNKRARVEQNQWPGCGQIFWQTYKKRRGIRWPSETRP